LIVVEPKPCPGLAVFNYQYSSWLYSYGIHGHNQVVYVSPSFNLQTEPMLVAVGLTTHAFYNLRALLFIITLLEETVDCVALKLMPANFP